MKSQYCIKDNLTHIWKLKLSKLPAGGPQPPSPYYRGPPDPPNFELPFYI